MLVDTIVLYFPRGLRVPNNLKTFMRNGKKIYDLDFAQIILTKKAGILHTYLKCSLAKIINNKNYGIDFNGMILKESIIELEKKLLSKGIKIDIKEVRLKRIDIAQDLLIQFEFNKIKKALSFLRIHHQSKKNGMYNNVKYSSIYFQNNSKVLNIYNKTKQVQKIYGEKIIDGLVRFELRLKTLKIIERKIGKIQLSEIVNSPDYYFQLCNKLLKLEIYNMFKPAVYYMTKHANNDHLNKLIFLFGERFLEKNSDMYINSDNPYNQKVRDIIKKSKKNKLNFCFQDKDAFYRLLNIKDFNLKQIIKYIGLIWLYDNYDFVEREITKKRPELFDSLIKSKEKIVSSAFIKYQYLYFFFNQLSHFYFSI